jgi:hypothetical protein
MISKGFGVWWHSCASSGDSEFGGVSSGWITINNNNNNNLEITGVD